MGTLRSYIVGFLLSILLTILAPALLWLHILMDHKFPTHQMLGIAFVVLAILQLAVQLVFFLHIGKKENSGWRLIALSFAFFTVAVVVGGSLWIMNNLNHMQALNTTQPFIGNVITPQNEDD